MASASLNDRIKSRENFHTSFKDSVDADLKQTGYNDLNKNWHSIRMFIMSITRQYERAANSDIPQEVEFEYDLHELWYWVVHSARYLSSDHPAQDRLVNQVLHAREMGVLSRKKIEPSKAGEGEEEEHDQETETATTSDGNIWADLPFLVDEVQAAWKTSTKFPSVERHNLSAFIARLASVGVRDPELGIVALWILRDTLETPRPLTGRTGEATNTSDSEQQLTTTVADLLPATLSWFLYCGYRIRNLCLVNQNFEADSETGELAKAANVTPNSGFSVARWMFWRDRLEEISRCEDEVVAPLALRTWRIMKGWDGRIETTN
jgi:hypothetical protein